jgi:hypothetical protein
MYSKGEGVYMFTVIGNMQTHNDGKGSQDACREEAKSTLPSLTNAYIILQELRVKEVIQAH